MKRITKKKHYLPLESVRIVRFIITAVWNNVFGVLVYITLYEEKQRLNFLVLNPCNILAMTNAYFD